MIQGPFELSVVDNVVENVKRRNDVEALARLLFAMLPGIDLPRALLRGRFTVGCEDVRTVAKPVLRHRIFTNFNADAEGISPDGLVDMLISAIAEPRVEDYKAHPATA